MEAVRKEDYDVVPLSEQAGKGIRRPEHSKMFNETLICTDDPNGEFAAAFMAVWKDLDAAMASDQTAEMKTKSGSYNVDYSSLAYVMKMIKAKMIKQDLMFQQYTGKISSSGTGAGSINYIPIITKVMHVPSGEYQIFLIPIPVGQATAHAIGSALTFGKRYSLMSYFGLATVDDNAMKSLNEKIDDAEAEEISQAIIERMKDCKTVEQLNEWGEKNSIAIKMLGSKTSYHIYQEFKSFKETLPDAAPEKEAPAQLDLEDAINGKGEAA